MTTLAECQEEGLFIVWPCQAWQVSLQPLPESSCSHPDGLLPAPWPFGDNHINSSPTCAGTVDFSVLAHTASVSDAGSLSAHFFMYDL